MLENEFASHWEPVSKDCRALVTKAHGFTTDTLLLADFSMPWRGESCADFGTGCGVIPLLWRARGKPGSITGVELQPEAAELARQSVEENGFSREIRIICGDVRGVRDIFPSRSLDLIACNPPYYAAGRGLVSENQARRTARHGETLTLEDLAGAARYALRDGGRLCVCLRAERLAEAVGVFRENRLEPKRLRLVQPNRKKPPYLFLLECRSGGRTGLTAEPTLLLAEESGKPTLELERIFGDYRKNAGWKEG